MHSFPPIAEYGFLPDRESSCLIAPTGRLSGGQTTNGGHTWIV